MLQTIPRNPQMAVISGFNLYPFASAVFATKFEVLRCLLLFLFRCPPPPIIGSRFPDDLVYSNAATTGPKNQADVREDTTRQNDTTKNPKRVCDGEVTARTRKYTYDASCGKTLSMFRYLAQLSSLLYSAHFAQSQAAVAPVVPRLVPFPFPVPFSP